MEFPFPVSYGQLYLRHPLGKDTRGIRVPLKGHPIIPEVSAIVKRERNFSPLVIPVKAGKKPQVHQGLKSITDSQNKLSPFYKLEERLADVRS